MVCAGRAGLAREIDPGLIEHINHEGILRASSIKKRHLPREGILPRKSHEHRTRGHGI